MRTLSLALPLAYPGFGSCEMSKPYNDVLNHRRRCGPQS
jgi:hypothetical protein